MFLFNYSHKLYIYKYVRVIKTVQNSKLFVGFIASKMHICIFPLYNFILITIMMRHTVIRCCPIGSRRILFSSYRQNRTTDELRWLELLVRMMTTSNTNRSELNFFLDWLNFRSSWPWIGIKVQISRVIECCVACNCRCSGLHIILQMFYSRWTKSWVIWYS